MTENLAGRGEGLAGLVARLDSLEHTMTELIRWIDSNILDCPVALEAAAPAGTPVVAINAAIKRIIAKCEQYWNVDGLCDAEVHASLERIHDDASLVAGALATPSPQAPPIEVHNESTPGAVKSEPLIYATQEPAGSVIDADVYCGLCGRIIDQCADYRPSSKTDICAGWTHTDGGHYCIDAGGKATQNLAVPAATQEQPAGSGDLLTQILDFLDEVTPESDTSHWAARAYQEIGKKFNVGSPRKVGEDGAQIADLLVAHEGRRDDSGRPICVCGWVARDLTEADRPAKFDPTLFHGDHVAAEIIALSRSSSVPVGEQKQEEGATKR